MAVFNENDAVLTSVWPKAFPQFEPPECCDVKRGHAVIYLGRDCDVLHSALGPGRWDQANGAFGVVFEDGRALFFPRQELWGLDGELSAACAAIAGGQ